MVIDSHALYWWLEGDGRLPLRGRKRIDQALGEGGGGILVAAVTFWEMRMKERRGLIEPKLPVDGWPGVLGRHEAIRIVATDSAIWMRSADLPWDHSDPADRIIAATALVHGMPVLTKDGRFHQEDSPVEAVW